MDNRPIGVFDSGIGGLSLVSEIKRRLPGESVIYLADVARQPFGEKTKDEVVSISTQIADFLAERGVKAIVIACSTATAVALKAISERYAFPVAGIINSRLVEDVLKATSKKKVGIISTELTAKTGSFKTAIQSADPGVEIISVPCSRLVNMISEGDIFDEKIASVTSDFIYPIISAGADALVLGCTHFNFITDVVEKAAGESVRVVSPPSSTVSFLEDALKWKGLLASPGNQASHRYFATGDSAGFSELVSKLWKDNGDVRIEHFDWPAGVRVKHGG